MPRLNIAAPEFDYDPTDPDGFRAGAAVLKKLTGATESGITVYELPPGQAVCPYHYELGEEEWLIVLAGNPTLRTPAGEERLEPWDVAFFPHSPEGAHRIANETEETVRVLMFSTVVTPTATVYPDSDKVGIYTGDPESEVIARRRDAVGYYVDEPGVDSP